MRNDLNEVSTQLKETNKPLLDSLAKLTLSTTTTTATVTAASTDSQLTIKRNKLTTPAPGISTTSPPSNDIVISNGNKTFLN